MFVFWKFAQKHFWLGWRLLFSYRLNFKINLLVCHIFSASVKRWSTASCWTRLQKQTILIIAWWVWEVEQGWGLLKLSTLISLLTHLPLDKMAAIFADNIFIETGPWFIVWGATADTTAEAILEYLSDHTGLGPVSIEWPSLQVKGFP